MPVLLRWGVDSRRPESPAVEAEANPRLRALATATVRRAWNSIAARLCGSTLSGWLPEMLLVPYGLPLAGSNWTGSAKPGGTMIAPQW
ncbi:hypothetical protein SFUMM280S_03148 [Streptomyces fumanus]